jgi:hypothetical protein
MKTWTRLAAGTAPLILVAAGYLYEDAREHRQSDALRAFLQGDPSIRLEAIDEYDYSQECWRPLYSEPETVRYLENRMQNGDTRDPNSRPFGQSFTTLTWRLRFTGGRYADVIVYWFSCGFDMHFIGDTMKGDGGTPRVTAVFKPPLPASFVEVAPEMTVPLKE